MMMDNRTMNSEKELWDLDPLQSQPVVYDAAGFESEGVKAIYFDGLDFRGNPTRVFAWVGFPVESDGKKVPGMVLIHGGGGTAYAEWVRIWNKRGYAAMAVSTTGKDGIEIETPEQSKLQPHQWAGPTEEDKFRNIEAPYQDHWAYHAVADGILACSVLASYPQVDSDSIGIAGVSWGGFLAGIISSIDKRFKCAVSAYGCGFINIDSPTFLYDKDSTEGKRWFDLWDPSNYLPENDTPFLWFTGTNDPAYPLNILEKSYSLLGDNLTLRIIPDLYHSHVDAWKVQEQYAFVDSYLKGGVKLPEFSGTQLDGDKLSIKYSASEPVKKAACIFTCCDCEKWVDKKWQNLGINVESPGEGCMIMPNGWVAAFADITSDSGLTVSSRILHN